MKGDAEMDKNEFIHFRARVLELRQLRSFADELERAKYGGAAGTDLEGRVVRHLDALALYREKLAAIEAELVAVEEAIASLESPVERLLMRLRYMEGRCWTSVCAALRPLGYSERQVYRLHGFALRKLKEVAPYGRD